jgi:AcrR family transcriptional regulator
MKNVNQTHRQRQAMATRQIIVDAAKTLFLTNGYGATTIEAISGLAGVGVSTVYAIYKNKRGILNAIRMAWHDESQQREIYAEALQEPDPERRFRLAAKATRRQWETGADMVTIYHSAAAVDAEAAAELTQALEGRRTALQRFIEASSAMLRPELSAQQAAAIYLALTRVEVYQELVSASGWSPDAYEAWLATVLQQQLLP